jgi:hypothetical protein
MVSKRLAVQLCQRFNYVSDTKLFGDFGLSRSK